MIKENTTLQIGGKFTVPRDVLAALWSTNKSRQMIALSKGDDYECIWIWETSWGEVIATISSPRLPAGERFSVIVGTHWGHTPARTIMTQIPYSTGDIVADTRTGKIMTISEVLLHADHCEYHYKFERESEDHTQNMRWHHELKKFETAGPVQLIPSDEEIPMIDATIDMILEEKE